MYCMSGYMAALVLFQSEVGLIVALYGKSMERVWREYGEGIYVCVH